MDYPEKLEELARRVDAVEAGLVVLTAKTDAQTIMLEKIERAVGGALASPRVRDAIFAVWTTLWVAFTGWLASRGNGVPP